MKERQRNEKQQEAISGMTESRVSKIVCAAMVFVFGSYLYGALPLKYSADSSDTIESPILQGWTESGIDALVTVEAVVDNGVNAWRISDNTSGNNPRYAAFLTEDDLGQMYDRGWEYSITFRGVEGSDMCGFSGWGLTVDKDPGWALTGRERVGFSIMQIAVDNSFEVNPTHGGSVNLGAGSADEFHTIECLGQPYSSKYDFYLDGILKGTYDIKDGGSNSSYDNQIRFASGSTSGTGRATHWNLVSLKHFGVSINQSDGDTIVAEENQTTDTYTISLSKTPLDTVTLIVDPSDNESDGMDIDLGAGPGVEIVLEWSVENYDEVKTVTVTAVDDNDSEGSHQVIISHTIQSEDSYYSGLDISDVIVEIIDNDPYCGDDTTVYLPSDINRDCRVNLIDLGILADDWLKCSDPGNGLCKPFIPPMAPVITDVFVEGLEGYHTYRIPAVLTTKAGTILALCEGRESRSDSAQNDIVIKRSSNYGRTWESLMLIDERGDDNLNNPQLIQVRETGRILLHYSRFPQDCHVGCVQTGYEGSVERIYQTYSDDDGGTWSVPEDITQIVREDNMTMAIPGIGVGIQLRRGAHAGRILMPYIIRWPDRPKNIRAIMSDDLGQTWFGGEYPGYDLTGSTISENQMVELIDGTIMTNGRSTSGKKRVVATSMDSGMTWGQCRQDPVLIEPQCMGTIFRLSDPLDGRKSRILFANPASTSSRSKGTVRLSYDEGETWSVSKLIEPDYYAYSALTVLEDGTIGLLYEANSYGKIKFARFNLQWLTDGNDYME